MDLSPVQWLSILHTRSQSLHDSLQGDRDIKNREADRRKNTTPSTTLFVVNFDVVRTRERDLQDLYERYGRLRRVQVRLPCLRGYSTAVACLQLTHCCSTAPYMCGTAMCCGPKQSCGHNGLGRGRLLCRSRRALPLSRCDTFPLPVPVPHTLPLPCCRSRGSFAFVEV